MCNILYMLYVDYNLCNTSENLSMFACPYCANFSAKHYTRVLTHIEEIHQHQAGFQIICHFCPQTYSKVSSYRYIAVCVYVSMRVFCWTTVTVYGQLTNRDSDLNGFWFVHTLCPCTAYIWEMSHSV